MALFSLRILRSLLACLLLLPFVSDAFAQEDAANVVFDPVLFEGLDYRMVGPHRGGRVTAVTGVPGDPTVLYFGSTGGGVWRSTTYGAKWENISDGYFAVGSMGSIAVAASDAKVMYAGTGSAGIRSNVSTGRGVYK